MKIVRIYNAVVNATVERRFISKTKNNKNINDIEKTYYKSLINVSGPSVHKPKKVINSWIKAYKHQIERQKMIEQANKPFKKQNLMSQIFNRLKNK